MKQHAALRFSVSGKFCIKTNIKGNNDLKRKIFTFPEVILMNTRTKRIIKRIISAAVTSAAIALVVLYAVSFAVPLESENTLSVYDCTVRLHVLANSDSEYDQSLKMAVRDDVIGVAAEILGDCKSMDEAKTAIEQNVSLIEDAARTSVEKHGSDYNVSAVFGKERYPVRRYGEFTFPAGEYYSLRIKIGEAKGRNWWCVLFPPLGVSAAGGDLYAGRETFLRYGFTEDQVDGLLEGKQSDKREIRFAVWEKIAERFFK